MLDLELVLDVDDSALLCACPSLASLCQLQMQMQMQRCTYIGNRKWIVYSKLYLVQMRFPLQTNQILQEGFAFRCTVSAFLDLGVRIFLASCIMLHQGRQ